MTGSIVRRLMPMFVVLAIAIIAGCDGSEGRYSFPVANKLRIAPAPLANARVGDNYTAYIEASGGIGGYSWDLVGGELPLGLMLSPGGTPKTAIYGVPAYSGDYTFSVQVKDMRGEMAITTLTLTVTATTLQITTATLAEADYNKPYSQFVRAVKGSGQDYHWSIVGGALPPGISLAQTGTPQAIISGTCDQPGQYQFLVRVVDSEGNHAERSLQIKVLPVLTVITTQITPDPCEGVPFVGMALQATGGTGLYYWMLQSPAFTLPPGMTLDTHGVLSGTPQQSGYYIFAARVGDSHNIQATGIITMNVLPRVDVTPTTLAEGTQGVFYSQQFAAAGGDDGPWQFTLADPPPPGLSLSTDGLLSGVPAAIGAFSVKVKASSSASNYGIVACVLNVAAPLEIVTTSLPTAYQATFYAQVITPTGGTGPFEWSVDGDLPPGLEFVPTGNPGTTLYGAPGEAGTYTFTMMVSDSQGRVGSREFTLVVDLTPGYIATFAGGGPGGDGGPAAEASLRAPAAMVFDAQGNLYFCDRGNHRVRRVDAVTGVITTFAGTGIAGSGGDGGPAAAAQLHLPTGLAFDPFGNLFISEFGSSAAIFSGHRIRKINMTTGVITKYAGLANAITQDGDGGPALVANVSFPAGICFDTHGNLYIACPMHHTVRKVTPQGDIETFAGIPYYNGAKLFGGNGGPAAQCLLHYPWSVSVDLNNSVYICDTGNSCVRRVPFGSGTIYHFAGQWPGGMAHPVSGSGADGLPAGETALAAPVALCFDGQGSIYIADAQASVIRRITPQGVMATMAGQAFVPQVADNDHGDGSPATSARFTAMTDLADFSGPRALAKRGVDIFVADAGLLSDRIRRVVKP